MSKTKYTNEQAAEFINAQTYIQFEMQVRGMVAKHFDVCLRTAAKMVQRCYDAGLINKSCYSK